MARIQIRSLFLGTWQKARLSTYQEFGTILVPVVLTFRIEGTPCRLWRFAPSSNVNALQSSVSSLNLFVGRSNCS